MKKATQKFTTEKRGENYVAVSIFLNTTEESRHKSFKKNFCRKCANKLLMLTKGINCFNQIITTYRDRTDGKSSTTKEDMCMVECRRYKKRASKKLKDK